MIIYNILSWISLLGLIVFGAIKIAPRILGLKGDFSKRIPFRVGIYLLIWFVFSFVFDRLGKAQVEWLVELENNGFSLPTFLVVFTIGSAIALWNRLHYRYQRRKATKRAMKRDNFG